MIHSPFPWKPTVVTFMECMLGAALNLFPDPTKPSLELRHPVWGGARAEGRNGRVATRISTFANNDRIGWRGRIVNVNRRLLKYLIIYARHWPLQQARNICRLTCSSAIRELPHVRVKRGFVTVTHCTLGRKRTWECAWRCMDPRVCARACTLHAFPLRVHENRKMFF